MSPPRPLHIILDFDGTITARDTIDPLVQAALALKPPSWPPAAAAWEECQTTYVRELDAHQAAHAPPSGPGFAGDVAALGGLWWVEEASVRRVGEAGIFAGVTGGMLRERGGEVVGSDGEGGVVVRKGFGEFVDEIERRAGAAWGVVSVNWSRAWIRGVMGAVLGVGRMDEVTVLANEINDETGMIEGCRLDPSSPTLTLLLTTTNKLLATATLFSNFQITSASAEPLTIFLGDSSTDLAPLLFADIGIILLSSSSSSSSFTASIKARGYDVIPVKEYKNLYVPGACRQTARFLSAWDYEEILESGVLSDEEWDPKGAMEKWCLESNDGEACKVAQVQG